MSFTDKLKQARLAAGLTQQQVADAMGITNSAYCGYETGKRQPDVQKIKQLSKILGVSGDDLLETGYSTPSKPDVLDEVDIAFYGEYKQLTEDDKDTIRDMVRIMRERRAKKQE